MLTETQYDHGTRVRHPFSGGCGTLWADSEGDLWLRWDTPDEGGDPVDVDPNGYPLTWIGTATKRADEISREAHEAQLAEDDDWIDDWNCKASRWHY